MSASLRIFFWGLFISFVGTLPLGTLNVAAMQIGIQEGIKQAVYFSIGALIIEMVYVRISLVGIGWIRRRAHIMKMMEWITLLLILALAAGSFIAALKGGEGAKNIILQNSIHRFLLGLFMSAINPVQIPFWFGWSTILFAKNILGTSSAEFNIYISGIGIGTLGGFCVFIFGGAYLFQHISDAGKYINWVIGFIFLITALIQFWKIMRHKGAAERVKEQASEELSK